ncbi:MAG TPA: hypothetical protein VN888_15785 [Mycobacterium sp.]|nr:hypothetical protein [Mycobacterium sp.]
MGRYRGGRKPWEAGDAGGRTVDPRQYPELNAVFYGGDPAEYIKMRIEALSLMACSDAQLSLAFGWVVSHAAPVGSSLSLETVRAPHL